MLVHKKKFAITLLPSLLIISLIACCIEMDMVVPSFPDMARYFNTTEEHIQWTLGLNFFGFFTSALLYGPLSESLGRRKIMLWGNILFLIGGLGCALSPSLFILILFRFLQGIGASASCVVAFVMITDVFHGEKALKFIGRMNSILTATVAIAPVTGAFVCLYYGWRANYTAIAIISFISALLLYIFLPETKSELKPLNFKKIIGNYKKLLSNITFVLYALIPTILSVAYIAFISSAPFLYINQMKVPLYGFAFHQACFVASFSITSFFADKIQHRFGIRNCSLYGTLISLISTFGIVLLGIYLPNNPYTLTAFMSLEAIGSAVAYTVIFSASLEIVPEIRGSASSMILALRLLFCAIGTFLSGIVYNGNLLPIAIIIFCSMLIAFIMTWITFFNKAD